MDDLKFSNGDKLLLRVRSRLRKEYNVDTQHVKPEDFRYTTGRSECNHDYDQPWNVIAIYSPSKIEDPRPYRKIQLKGNLQCGNGAGSAAYVTGSFGFFAAGECVNQILMINHKREIVQQILLHWDKVIDTHCNLTQWLSPKSDGGTDKVAMDSRKASIILSTGNLPIHTYLSHVNDFVI